MKNHGHFSFKSLDTDNTGRVSSQEFLDRLLETGLRQDDPRLAESLAVLDKFDGLRRDVMLTEEQFVAIAEPDSSTLGDAQKLLEQYGNSEKITASQMETMLHQLGVSGADLPGLVENILRRYDQNQDGVLDLAELATYVLTSEASADFLFDDNFAALTKFFRAYRSKDHTVDIPLIYKALQGRLAVPEFRKYTTELEDIYNLTRNNADGANASYIPELARVDPSNFGIAICTVDGQRWGYGDCKTGYCIQSCSKAITYLAALQEHGYDYVHHHIGVEPSGMKFNSMKLKDTDVKGRKIPHNPMINAGAIMCCALVKQGQSSSRRFAHIMETWTRLCGGTQIGFQNSTYLSESSCADRNWCLGYMMKEYDAFPKGTDLKETLEFYFQCCSIEVDCEQMALMAGTLANGGTCPTTGDKVFEPQHVKNCLSLMLSCGMYDYSGEWAFRTGSAAKSGVGGSVFVVVPNRMGICIWSPRLDKNGNSVRGVEFTQELCKRFNFHKYENLRGVVGQSDGQKKDPSRKENSNFIADLQELIYAASEGDVKAIQSLHARMFNIFAGDYDRRTALHLAASEGQTKVVEFLLEKALAKNKDGVDEIISAVDRWGGTPLDDAERGGFGDIVEILEQAGARRGSEVRSK